MLNLVLPSFQLDVKEGEAKLQVDIVCDENSSCSVRLSRMDWYESTSQCILAALLQIPPIFWLHTTDSGPSSAFSAPLSYPRTPVVEPYWRSAGGGG